jgi:hypothetical protein
MFDDPPAPEEGPTKPQPSSVWAQYASTLLPVAAVFGATGLLLLSLSLLASREMPNGTRGFALIDLVVATIAALVGLWWRSRHQTPAR